MHTTNYTDTFIETAEDCRARSGIEPSLKDKPTIARLQYELIRDNPYRYTSDDILLEVYMRRNGMAEGERETARGQLFAKPQACLRASDLPKKYGWGIHFNGESKAALYAVDSPEYEALRADPGLVHRKAMRSSRKG